GLTGQSSNHRPHSITAGGGFWIPAFAGMTIQREELASSPPRLLPRETSGGYHALPDGRADGHPPHHPCPVRDRQVRVRCAADREPRAWPEGARPERGMARRKAQTYGSALPCGNTAGASLAPRPQPLTGPAISPR